MTPQDIGSYYYLVVPINAVNEGSYGNSFDGSNWDEIPVGQPACNPQNLDPC